LKIKLPQAEHYSYIKNYLSEYNLHTICESGKCPNIAECWSAKTATFMILGDSCTRNCKFCAVSHGNMKPPDEDEPFKIAEAIAKIGLWHCVLTSVTRDDLTDGGAQIWYDTITAIKKYSKNTTIEALIPDFKGSEDSLEMVIHAKPEIISHNLETVERLSPAIRYNANYRRSLQVLKYIDKAGVTSKSGIMVGLGEKENEIYAVMDDLLSVNCKIITIGQYLQPARQNHSVLKYYTPEEFFKFKKIAMEKGFKNAECGPMIRSSYHAQNHISINRKLM
jgi:lipoic acid synthetase